MLDNKKRFGRFTSSGIYKLFGSASVRKTYIEEKVTEIRLGKSLDTDFWSKTTSWGTLMEYYAFCKLGFEWTPCGEDTILHKKYGDFWSGTPDLKKKNTGAEIKGYEYKKFCSFTDAILSQDIQTLKAHNKGLEYWQVVSNCILLGASKAVVVSCMPYESDFEILKNVISKLDASKDYQRKIHEECGWVVFKEAHEVCLLPDGGYYKDINTFEFEIPMEDIKALNTQIITDMEQLKFAKKAS